MCMLALTKRTNILFSDLTWKMLQEVSAAKSTSIGKLIRNAVKVTYFSQQQTNKRQVLLASISKLAKKVDTQNINYQELISHGRRF